jgi:hypothetical protein
LVNSRDNDFSCTRSPTPSGIVPKHIKFIQNLTKRRRFKGTI